MTPRMLRNAGLTSITALSLALVACGGSSSSTPAAPANKAPEWKTLPTSVPTLITGHPSVSVGISAVDPDGDAVTYTATSSDATVLQVSITAAGVITGKPLKAGSVTVTVEAKDGKGGVTVGQIPVTITANKLPVVGGLTNATVQAGNSLTLPLTVSDGDGDSVALTLDGTANPTWVTLSGNTLVVKPAATVAANSYEVKLKADDGFGGVTPVTAMITVTQPVNNPPTKVVAIADTKNNPHVDRTLVWTLGAYDPDGDQLTYIMSPVSDPEVVIEGNQLKWTPTVATPGKAVYVVAKDPRGAQSVEPTMITLPKVTENHRPFWSNEASTASADNKTGLALSPNDPNSGWVSNGGPKFKNADGSTYWSYQTWVPFPANPSAITGVQAANNLEFVTGATMWWDTVNAYYEDLGGALPNFNHVNAQIDAHNLPGYGDNSTWNLIPSDYPYWSIDLDEMDTLSYSVVSGGLDGVPAGLTVGADGVIEWTPALDQDGKVFLFRVKASDGLLSRETDEYAFKVRGNKVPEFVPNSNQLDANWVNPYSTAASQTLGSIAGIDMDGDNITLEPVASSVGNKETLRFDGNTYAPAASKTFNLIWRKEKATNAADGYPKAVPFTPVKFDYKLRDQWGATAAGSVNINVMGKASLVRNVTYVWPGNSSNNVEGNVAAAKAYSYKDPATALTGFWNPPVLMTGINADTAGAFTVPTLKNPSYLFNLKTDAVRSFWNNSTLGTFATMTNGGNGSVVTDFSETIAGRKTAVTIADVNATPVTTAVAWPTYTSGTFNGQAWPVGESTDIFTGNVLVQYNNDTDAYTPLLNAAHGFTAPVASPVASTPAATWLSGMIKGAAAMPLPFDDSTDLTRITLLAENKWQGTAGSNPSTVDQIFYAARRFSTGKISGGVYSGSAFADGSAAATGHGVNFPRSLWMAPYKAMNLAAAASYPVSSQVVFQANGYKVASLGLNLNHTNVDELAYAINPAAPLNAANVVAPRGVDLLCYYRPSGLTPSGTDALTVDHQGIDIILNNSAAGWRMFSDPKTLNYDLYNVAQMAGVKTFNTTAKIVGMVATRNAGQLMVNAPLTPAVSPVTAVKLSVGDSAAKTSATLPMAGNVVLADIVNATTGIGAITELNLNWTAAAGATEYVVELFNVTGAAGAPAIQVATFVTTKASLEVPVAVLDTTGATKYAFRIRAKKAAGNALVNGWADYITGQLF